MDSNNIFFKVIVGVILVGYMAFIFYQSLKGGIAYKKEFENFKNSHKHYETMVDGGYLFVAVFSKSIRQFIYKEQCRYLCYRFECLYAIQ